MRVLGSFSRNAMCYVPEVITDSHIFIPHDIFDAIVSQSGIITDKIQAIIFNEAFAEDGEIPISVDLIKSESPNGRTIVMNLYLYSFLLGTVQLDTDRFKVAVISDDIDDSIVTTKTIKKSLENIKKISNKPRIKNPKNPLGYATYYDPWVLKVVKFSLKQLREENEQEKNDRIFFSSLKIFIATNYLNPDKTSILYEINFRSGYQIEILESDNKSTILAKSILTCAETGTFYLKHGGKTFVKESIDFTDYKEALIDMNRATSSGY